MTEADEAPGEWELAEPEEPHSLADLVSGVLDRGVVVSGDVTVSLAGVDLVYLGLKSVLTSVASARERGAGAGPAAAIPETTPQRRGAGQPAAPLQPEREELAASGETAGAGTLSEVALQELAENLPDRLDIDPDEVRRDLARLVLTIVELLRQVVEHQAVQRMDDEALPAARVEKMGLALLRLEETMHELREIFGLAAEELQIDLGPLGKVVS
ncbi:MAG: gas vesicle protein GvpJ [Longimicrobiaceae bacterium]